MFLDLRARYGVALVRPQRADGQDLLPEVPGEGREILFIWRAMLMREVGRPRVPDSQV